MDAMGGLLKSEDESQAELEISKVKQGEALYRITTMFSATMPTGVERIAKAYLRHPVIIKIGDEDTGKNRRIEQRIQFISEGQKKSYLMEDLHSMKSTDKCIIFINAKKTGDMLGKLLEENGYEVGVLHGGKSQDLREETLEHFRKTKIRFLVATDVAGRGLDISDVTFGIVPYIHFINYVYILLLDLYIIT
jgi:ATP-dependent RNA helicase DDX23/PRP28